MYCPKCGKEITNDYKYCPFCGFNFENLEDTHQEQECKHTNLQKLTQHHQIKNLGHLRNCLCVILLVLFLGVCIVGGGIYYSDHYLMSAYVEGIYSNPVTTLSYRSYDRAERRRILDVDSDSSYMTHKEWKRVMDNEENHEKDRPKYVINTALIKRSGKSTVDLAFLSLDEKNSPQKYVSKGLSVKMKGGLRDRIKAICNTFLGENDGLQNQTYRLLNDNGECVAEIIAPGKPGREAGVDIYVPNTYYTIYLPEVIPNLPYNKNHADAYHSEAVFRSKLNISDSMTVESFFDKEISHSNQMIQDKADRERKEQKARIKRAIEFVREGMEEDDGTSVGK